MRINWREERLEDWRLQPPTYAAHESLKEQQKKKDEAMVAAAAISVNETDNAAATSNAPSSLFSESSSSEAHDDDITPVEERSEANGGLAHLDLAKTSSAGSSKGKETSTIGATTATPASRKVREVQRDNNAAEVQGVMFCF